MPFSARQYEEFLWSDCCKATFLQFPEAFRPGPGPLEAIRYLSSNERVHISAAETVTSRVYSAFGVIYPFPRSRDCPAITRLTIPSCRSEYGHHGPSSRSGQDRYHHLHQPHWCEPRFQCPRGSTLLWIHNDNEAEPGLGHVSGTTTIMKQHLDSSPSTADRPPKVTPGLCYLGVEREEVASPSSSSTRWRGALRLYVDFSRNARALRLGPLLQVR